MRFFKRNSGERADAEDTTTAAPSMMAGKRVRGVQVPETPALSGSERLRHIEERIVAQQALLGAFENDFRREAITLQGYSSQQQSNLDRILQHVEQGLRPLREYAAAEESNLRRLTAEMQARPASFITANFEEYVSVQEAGMRMTQRSIEHQREPFVDYFESQAEALEVALRRFDAFVGRLEESMEQQRQILEGLIEAARDEEFAEVKRFLFARQEIWESYIARGAEDPREAYRDLAELRNQFMRTAAGSSFAREVVAHVTAADETLREMVKPAATPETLAEAAAQRRSSAVAAAEVLRAVDAEREEEVRWVDIGPATLSDVRYGARAG